jgi:ABC-type molybdate transport system substrate-binding protein
VLAPADHLVIDAMLKPARLADFSIVFASGRMVLAYLATDSKAKALPVSGAFAPPSSVPQVGAGWYDVLTAPGVRISGAHPFMDPGGYRAHMIFELAQAHYKVPGLQNALLQHYQVNVADPSGFRAGVGEGLQLSVHLRAQRGEDGNAGPVLSLRGAPARDRSVS